MSTTRDGTRSVRAFPISIIIAAVIVITAAALFISLSGCLQRVGTGGQLYVDQYKSDIKRLAISDPSYYEECKIGKCRCFACKNGTNIFGPMRSLIGGYCYWENDCTQERKNILDNKNLSPDIRIREFMLGQGSTFADFAMAQPYCNNRMSMAVQWLVASNETNYTLPSAERSMCFLGMDIMPVYVLYSRGQNINSPAVHEIGRILGNDGRNVFMGRLSTGPVGPVVVVTEIDFNASQASDVANQVAIINQECGNQRPGKIYCQVAVAPKINDFKALDAVMQAAGPDNIDFVAFGINGHYVNSCDGSKINMQVLNFSSYALYNWSKPSIIPYVMFEPVGNDSNNSCAWTEEKVIRAYGTTFGNIQSMKERGVIGIAPYSFKSSTYNITNPLNCQDCAIARTPQRMNAWYSGCQGYTLYVAGGKTNPMGGNAIIFPDQPGGSCLSGASQLDYMFRRVSFADVMGNKDIMNPVTAQMAEPGKQLYACSECINQNSSGPPPFKFPVKAGAPSAEQCNNTVEIDQWASMRNLDPMFVRAIAYTESGFDKCAAAKVCSKDCIQSGCTDMCFTADFSGSSECYSKGYDEMHDPRETADPANACSFTGKNAIPEPGKPLAWRWCAVGLMQSLEPPYTFWPDPLLAPGLTGGGVDNPHHDVFERSGFWSSYNDPNFQWQIPMILLARGCDPKFNPFDPSDSLCMGTLKLEKMIRYGHAWIRDHPELGFGDAGVDSEKGNVFAHYIASNMYTGMWLSKARDPRGMTDAHPMCPTSFSNGACWTAAFADSRVVTPDYCSDKDDGEQCKDKKPRREPPFYCYGYTDFVEFVRDCWDPFNYMSDSGAKKMSAYYWFTQCDNSFCPYGKFLLHEMQKPMSATGNPYIMPDPNPTPAPVNP